MKKLNVFLIAISTGVLFASCGAGTKSSETITGSYRSIKGVMTDLSCYCYNSGYLTTESGELIPVCFPNDDTEIDYETVTFTGAYENRTVTSEPTSPCPPGERTLFIVQSHECK